MQKVYSLQSSDPAWSLEIPQKSPTTFLIVFRSASFTFNVEIIVKKDREIEQLRKSMEENKNVMKEMEIEMVKKANLSNTLNKTKNKLIFLIVTKQLISRLICIEFQKNSH